MKPPTPRITALTALSLLTGAPIALAIAAPATAAPSRTVRSSTAASPPPVPAHAVQAKTLPTGPASSFPFGYVKDSGTKISLPPPNAADVAQGRVSKAPKLGPFHINLAKSFGGWPSACSLSSAAQLKVLVPGVTGLKGKPVARKAEILGSGGNTPHPTDCKWNVKTTFDYSGQAVPSYVEISFEEIDSGAPGIWQQELKSSRGQSKKYPAQFAYYPKLPHGVTCFYDGTELQCLKGDMDFWVMGQKVTSGNFPSADAAVWIDQAELPLAEVVAEEVTTSA